MPVIVRQSLRRLRREDGQTTVEYVLLAIGVAAITAAIAAAIIGRAGPIGDLLKGLFDLVH